MKMRRLNSGYDFVLQRSLHHSCEYKQCGWNFKSYCHLFSKLRLPLFPRKFLAMNIALGLESLLAQENLQASLTNFPQFFCTKTSEAGDSMLEKQRTLRNKKCCSSYIRTPRNSKQHTTMFLIHPDLGSRCNCVHHVCQNQAKDMLARL